MVFVPQVAPDPNPTSTGGRIAWIDAARGLAILTIVVYHLLLWDFSPNRERCGRRRWGSGHG